MNESFLRPLIRRTRRIALSGVLAGSAQDRWNFCIGRAASKYANEMLIYGSAIMDTGAAAKRAVHWFQRLERIAGPKWQA